MFDKRRSTFITLAAALALMAAGVPVRSIAAGSIVQDPQDDCLFLEPAREQDPDFVDSLQADCRPTQAEIHVQPIVSAQNITPGLKRGPDIYGYIWDDSVPFSWIDTTGGVDTGLNDRGGAAGPIALPFRFEFYDNTYNNVYITSAGYLRFQNFVSRQKHQKMPDSDPPNNVIAPYWTRTYLPEGAWIHYQSGGTAPNRFFVVEWHNLAGGPPADPVGGDDRYLFQVVLFESGDIQFQYSSMEIGENGWCARAGLEDSTGQDGVTYLDACGGVPGSARAVQFYRPKNSKFTDTPASHWAYEWIQRLDEAGITSGCAVNPLQYCPDEAVTRGQLAVLLLRALHGSSYTPPPAGASIIFGDVPASYWSAAWIEQLAREGIAGGCGEARYCPESAVTRAQMAVLLLKTKYGPAYTPPQVESDTGFSDVPADHWAAAWIRQIAAEGLTGGCASGLYCPESPVTRAQTAVFLAKTFDLP